MVNHSRRSFKVGEVVYHSRLGEGTILDEWGVWIDVDERGNELPINGKGIFEVEFKTGRTLSVNRRWLSHGSRRSVAEQTMVAATGDPERYNQMDERQAIDAYTAARAKLWPGNPYRMQREHEWALARVGAGNGDPIVGQLDTPRAQPFDGNFYFVVQWIMASKCFLSRYYNTVGFALLPLCHTCHRRLLTG